MKITKIEAQAKREGRYSVYVDDKFVFGISELGLIDTGLQINLELTPEQLEELNDKAQKDKLYNMALGLLARRPRSEWELRHYLKRKSIQSEAADAIISKLQDRGFVDDYDFARRWVESRRLLKPISRRKLELELRAKRVSDVVVKQALELDETDEYDVIVQEVDKKRRQTRYQDDTKLMQYLARQGYNYGDIKQALSDDAR